MKESNTGCRIAKAELTVDVKFTLPELAQASDEVKEVWSQWYPRLVFHENQHKDHAITIAEEIEQGLLNLPPSETCKQQGKNANQLGHSIVKRLPVMDKEYDKRTNHGETEGAWLYQYLK